jgi:hypothetical protein
MTAGFDVRPVAVQSAADMTNATAIARIIIIPRKKRVGLIVRM